MTSLTGTFRFSLPSRKSLMATFEKDANGHSHIRAAFLGPSLSIPFDGGRPVLGTWQQVVFVDLDNKPRRREVLVHLVGE